MFNPVQNSWAQQDYAHYQREDAREAREAMHDEYHDFIVNNLISIGQAYGKNGRMITRIERAQRDEAMENAIDWIFNDRGKRAMLELSLLQIWATYRNTEDSPLSRLANVIEYGIAGFAGQKARAKYQ